MSNCGHYGESPYYGRDGMGSNMEQNLAEEDDRCVVARRIFKGLCALYPDRYLMLVLPGNVLVLPGDVASDPPTGGRAHRPAKSSSSVKYRPRQGCQTCRLSPAS